MRASAQIRVAIAVGLIGASPLLVSGETWLFPLVAWDIVCAVYLLRVWATIARSNAERTAEIARPEDPSPATGDILVLAAALASFAAVGIVLHRAAGSGGTTQDALAGLGLLSEMLAWTMVHTIYTLQYARMYYDEHTGGGIDFNQAEKPRYVDFAYLAFTIGMTFQVSDTAVSSTKVRATTLRHALLSFVFVAGILATTVNLIASLRG
jgi:uncharacterized membrane protein